ncbi:MAG: kinase-associated lipoprotein B [Bacillus sp. (in: firmicutes)]
MKQIQLPIGQKVTAIYKTGKYIGEITGISELTYLVKILAVCKHPTQGDLHHPKETDVAFFHTRKALAWREQTNVPRNMVKPFEGEIPDYKQSLRESIEKAKQSLQTADSAWNKKSLDALEELELDYFKKK